jgi:hypothetical protein
MTMLGIVQTEIPWTEHFVLCDNFCKPKRQIQNTMYHGEN